MMLSKDIFRRYWYYSSSAFSSFSSSRNRPFAEDTWRREFTCMHAYSSLLSGLWGLSIWLEAWIEGFAYLQYLHLPFSTRKKGTNNNNTTLSIHSQIPQIPPSPTLLNPHPMPPNPLHPPRRKATNIQQLLQLPISQHKFLLHHKPSHSLRTRRSRQRTTIRPISPLFLHQFLPNILPH